MIFCCAGPRQAGDSLPHDGGSCPVGDCINIFSVGPKPPGYQPGRLRSRSIWLKGGLRKWNEITAANCCFIQEHPASTTNSCWRDQHWTLREEEENFLTRNHSGAHRISGPQKAFPRFCVDGEGVKPETTSALIYSSGPRFRGFSVDGQPQRFLPLKGSRRTLRSAVGTKKLNVSQWRCASGAFGWTPPGLPRGRRLGGDIWRECGCSWSMWTGTCF